MMGTRYIPISSISSIASIAITVSLIIMLMSHTACLASKSEEVPYAARFIVYKAQQLMKKKEYEQAIRLLRKFQEKRKRHSKSYLVDFALGNCFFMKGEYSVAIRYYQNATEKNHGFSAGWLNLAQCLHELKRYSASADAFIKAYNTSSNKNPDYLYYAGICLLSAGRHEDSIKILESLLSLNNNPKIEWKEALAHAYISHNEPKKALPFIEQLSEETKGNKRKTWQQVRVQTYFSLNMDKKALSYLERLIREDPTDPNWWRGLSHLYLKENRYKDALAALIIKDFISPASKQEEKIMAQLSMAVGIPRQALRLYRRLSKKEPSPKLLYYMAQCYIRLNRPKDALIYMNKAIKLDPKDKKLLFLKAQLLYQLERYRKAAVLFEMLAKQNVKPGRSWLMAGYAYLNSGDTKKAYHAFTKAKKYPGQRDSAAKALKITSAFLSKF